MPGSSGVRRCVAGLSKPRFRDTVQGRNCPKNRVERAEQEALKLLRALDEGVAARTGAAFFPHLVSALAQTLGASCAFASEFVHETYEAHVLAFWCDGSFGENFVYPLTGSP